MGNINPIPAAPLASRQRGQAEALAFRPVNKTAPTERTLLPQAQAESEDEATK
jgi:hypothetical protein